MTLIVRKRSRLPHWQEEGAIYFVTFNLKDAISRPAQERIEAERRIRLAELERLKQQATRAELHAIEAAVRRQAEECLDHAGGECWMRDPRAADIVAAALLHFDGIRYELSAWCVMPNHVHAVVRPRVPLERVIHSWKSYSAHALNQLLGRRGPVWQQEYFDRVMRTREHFDRAVRYVLTNPAKAGLRDWRWVGWRAGE